MEYYNAILITNTILSEFSLTITIVVIMHIMCVCHVIFVAIVIM